MTYAILFKELSKIRDIPFFTIYIFIFEFFSKQSAVYLSLYRKHIGIQFQIYTRNGRQSSKHNKMPRYSHLLNFQNRNAKNV